MVTCNSGIKNKAAYDRQLLDVDLKGLKYIVGKQWSIEPWLAWP